MDRPSDKNAYQADHAALLLRCYEERIGEPLIASDDPREVYEAPFAILSHDISEDPILTYGNLASQRLWDISWEELTQMPSRLTAEPGHRDQRAAMFEEMRKTGAIRNYEGVRIAKSGQRFRIRNATIWSLTDLNGDKVGEAATFKEYTLL